MAGRASRRPARKTARLFMWRPCSNRLRNTMSRCPGTPCYPIAAAGYCLASPSCPLIGSPQSGSPGGRRTQTAPRALPVKGQRHDESTSGSDTGRGRRLRRGGEGGESTDRGGNGGSSCRSRRRRCDRLEEQQPGGGRAEKGAADDYRAVEPGIPRMGRSAERPARPVRAAFRNESRRAQPRRRALPRAQRRADRAPAGPLRGSGAHRPGAPGRVFPPLPRARLTARGPSRYGAGRSHISARAEGPGKATRPHPSEPRRVSFARSSAAETPRSKGGGPSRARLFWACGRRFRWQVVAMDGPTFELEALCIGRGFARVAGLDEVGRGPLAGPVTAAAVVLDAGRLPDGLNDSKKLTAEQRDALLPEIMAAAEVSVGHASVEEIDRLNILRAAHLAMVRAFGGLSVPPDHLLIDGTMIPRDITCPAS